MKYQDKKKKVSESRENGFLLIALLLVQVVLLVAKLMGADINWWMTLVPLIIGCVAVLLYGIWLMVSVICIACNSYGEESSDSSEDEDYDG